MATDAQAQPASCSPSRGNILDLIGNTPLVKILRMNPNPKVEIWAKLEAKNPGGSVKDRIGLEMIEQGERLGQLTRDKIILEPTSGNTGIGLALVAAVKGYRILLAMSEGVSVERRRILLAFGAQFLLTPAQLGTDGAIEEAYRIARKEPDKYFMPDQFNNPANVLAHYKTTGPEIWRQTGGRVTHFVAAMGTTGTLMGAGRFLKEQNPAVQIIGVEPYLGHKIQGLKNLKEAYRPGIFQRQTLDEKINVHDDEAFETARRLAREEGILAGMSCGAAMCIAMQNACALEQGLIVVLLPDGGERYLSTVLYQVPAIEKKQSRLKLYSTLSRKREVFESLVPAEATMYCCGPTVDRPATLAFFRRLVLSDLLRRLLEQAGYSVRQVINITDLDDRTITAAQEAGRELASLTAEMTASFQADAERLGIKPAWKYPAVSRHVPDMIAFAEKLVAKGAAYEKLRSLYFDLSRLPQYGRLSGVDVSKVRVGTTVDLDEYEKDNPRDFTLLKRSTLAEMRQGIFFESPWGNVRPSWHIECAAISSKYFGEQCDIHVSSADLLFPHAENVLAQCEAVHGKPPARFWLHAELVLAGGAKMSRSRGNAVTVPELIAQGFTGREIRFFLLSTHYRQALEFSPARLEQARKTLRKIESFIRQLEALRSERCGAVDVDSLVKQFEESYSAALDEDLNVSRALAACFDLIRKLNPLLSGGTLGAKAARLVLDAFRRFDEIMGVLDWRQLDLPSEVAELVEQREAARKAANFAAADELRRRIAELGYAVEDTPSGPRLAQKGRTP